MSILGKLELSKLDSWCSKLLKISKDNFSPLRNILYAGNRQSWEYKALNSTQVLVKYCDPSFRGFKARLSRIVHLSNRCFCLKIATWNCCFFSAKKGFSFRFMSSTSSAFSSVSNWNYLGYYDLVIMYQRVFACIWWFIRNTKIQYERY